MRSRHTWSRTDSASASLPGRREATTLPPFRGLSVLVVGELLARVLSFLAFTVITRRLGPDAFGPVAVSLACLQVATLLVESGLPLIGAREVARDRLRAPGLLAEILTIQWRVALGLVFASFVALLSGVISGPLGALVPAYALTLLLLPPAARWLFQGLDEMRWIAWPQVTRYAAFLVLTMAWVKGPDDWRRLPWLELASLALSTSLCVIVLRAKGLSLSSPRERTPGLLSEAVLVGTTQLAWVVRMYLPTLILWSTVTVADVGRFDVAHRVFIVLQGLLDMYFVNVYPTLARATAAPRPELRALLSHSLLLTAGATLVAVLVGVPSARWTLGLLFGSSFAGPESVASLRWLLCALPVVAWRAHSRLVLIALRRPGFEVCASVLGIVVVATLSLAWAGRYGIAGAAAAILASEVLAAAVGTWLALKVSRTSPDRSRA